MNQRHTKLSVAACCASSRPSTVSWSVNANTCTPLLNARCTNLSLLEPTAYDYNRRLYSSLNRTTQVLGNQYKIILFNKLRRNCNYFKDKPILYIARGPSLDENLEWIKENQSKFFIVTIGATYKTY